MSAVLSGRVGAKVAMRQMWVWLHRWVGLCIAGFVIVSGLTGAVISWDHELDDLLNAHLLKSKSVGPRISSVELMKKVEAAEPRGKVAYFLLDPEPGDNAWFYFLPRTDPATGKLYDLGYNQVFMDPVTGKEVGRRDWGKAALTRENFVPFLYKFHYTLHMPEMWGIELWGQWLLGGVAILWTLDCFVSLLISFPNPRNWMRSFAIRWKAHGYRFKFDLHRAAGLWAWALFLILAFTAFSLNLYREVFFPAMSLVSNVSPTPFSQRKMLDYNHPSTPKITYEDAIRLAEAEAKRRGWTEPAGGAIYAVRFDLYGIVFHKPGDDHGAAGVGPARLYYDGQDGRYLGDYIPWKGTAADIFVQMQFPLHSGRILGLPGRILISLMGLVAAMLSVTGVYIWWRKLQSRKAARLLA